MAKKKARKTASGSTATETKSARGRKPNTWTVLQPADFVAFREKYKTGDRLLSEQKLADHVGVSLPTVRNYLSGKNAPTAEKQEKMKELLAKDYTPPAPKARKPRGKKGKAAAAEPSTSVAVARSAAASGDGNGREDAPLAAVVAEYMKRRPKDQPLDIVDLERDIERIKRALGV